MERESYFGWTDEVKYYYPSYTPIDATIMRKMGDIFADNAIEDAHTKKLRNERAQLVALITAEKGKSGLESMKAVNRLIDAIQAEGFTID